MKQIHAELNAILEESVSHCKSNSIALSGGLDSTILAYYMRNKKPDSIAVLTKDFIATDLTYCQLVAKEFDLPLKMELVSTEELLTGIEKCIKILLMIRPLLKIINGYVCVKGRNGSGCRNNIV